MKIGAWGFLVTLAVLCFLSSYPLISIRGLTAVPGLSEWDPKQVKLIGSVAASVIFGLFAMILILFKKDEADKKWAYGMLGTIIGYWLPSPVQ